MSKANKNTITFMVMVNITKFILSFSATVYFVFSVVFKKIMEAFYKFIKKILEHTSSFE